MAFLDQIYNGVSTFFGQIFDGVSWLFFNQICDGAWLVAPLFLKNLSPPYFFRNQSLQVNFATGDDFFG